MNDSTLFTNIDLDNLDTLTTQLDILSKQIKQANRLLKKDIIAKYHKDLDIFSTFFCHNQKNYLNAFPLRNLTINMNPDTQYSFHSIIKDYIEQPSLIVDNIKEQKKFVIYLNIDLEIRKSNSLNEFIPIQEENEVLLELEKNLPIYFAKVKQSILLYLSEFKQNLKETLSQEQFEELSQDTFNEQIETTSNIDDELPNKKESDFCRD